MKIEADNGHYHKKKGMKMPRPCRFVFSDDGVYVLDYGMSHWSLIVSAQFGLVGHLIYNYQLKKKKNQKNSYFNQHSLEEIVKADDKSFYYPLQTVSSFEAKTGFLNKFQGKKGVFMTIDGIEHRLYLQNSDFDQVLSWLKQKIGGREKQK